MFGCMFDDYGIGDFDRHEGVSTAESSIKTSSNQRPTAPERTDAPKLEVPTLPPPGLREFAHSDPIRANPDGCSTRPGGSQRLPTGSGSICCEQ